MNIDMFEPNNVDYSIRRFFVDDFLNKNAELFPRQAEILDVGGKKINKRGNFDIEKYSLKVSYLNTDGSTKPDFCCDAKDIPVGDACFDGIICCEVLEHVLDPTEVLRECYRVLRPGGRMLITIPFMYHIHADPYDFARYSDYYWNFQLEKIGFSNINIEFHGNLYAVLANLFKLWAREIHTSDGLMVKKYISMLAMKKMIHYLIKKYLDYENQPSKNQKKIILANTLGFGIVAEK